MPTKRLSMRRIRELLQLKYVQGLSERLIADTLGISKGAVGSYLQRARVAGLSWPLPAELATMASNFCCFPASPCRRRRVGRFRTGRISTASCAAAV